MATQTPSSDRSSTRFTSPVFPKTRCSLWDKTSVGQPVFLHISHYRKPRLCIPEKILKLVQHQCEIYSQSRHVLIGTLIVDDDCEGVQIQVDRLDTHPNRPLTSLDITAGNVLILLQVTNNTASERTVSVDDYVDALKHLQSRCCSKDSIDLCSFVHIYGWGSFYSNNHTSVVHMDFDMVTMETTFKSTPITPVPIVLTALSKNLGSLWSLSSMQRTAKTGYLTMDNTRKLLLVLESDPKSASLPVIGIWVSGVEFVHHPFVWAACLRYIHNTHLQDRVCLPPDQFLLVLYTPLHSKPEFYQCETNSRNTCLQFGLYSGHEVMNMDKVLTNPGTGNFIEVEMEAVLTGNKTDTFDAAKLKHGVIAEQVRVGYVSGQEDLEPRCAPTPHAEKVPVFHPMVPDVSILWGESYYSHTKPDLPERQSDESNIKQPLQQLDHTDILSRRDHPAPEKFIHTTVASPTGNFHHARVSPQHYTRPHLSQLYSLSGQSGHRLPLSVSNIHQPCSQPMSAGQTSVPAPHCRASVPQNQFPPSHSVISSNKVNLAHPIAGPVSPDYYQHLNAPAISHTMNQYASLSEPGGNNCQAFDGDQGRSHTGYSNSQRPRSIMVQHFDDVQFVASASRCGQFHPVPRTVPDSTQPHPCSRQTNGNVLKPPVVLQQVPAFPTRDCLQHGAALKTITEETSSQFSPIQKSGHHMGKNSQGAAIFELNDAGLKGKESNSSPPFRTSSRVTGEDSGFSMTPDRPGSSVPEHGAVSVVSSSPSTAIVSLGANLPFSTSLKSSIDSVTWEQIPSEVRALFLQQNEQLRVLQQQIEILQAQCLPLSQPGSPHHVVRDTTSSSQTSQTVKYKSVAVNTSFCSCQDDRADGYMMCDSQSTPVRARLQQEKIISPADSGTQTGNSPLKVCHKQQVPGLGVVATSGGGNLAVSSTGEALGHSPQGLSNCSFEEVNQKDLDAAIESVPVLDQTMTNDMSDLVVDMPDYASSTNDRSQMDRCSPSVSDYGQTQEDSYSTLGEEASDCKPHYRLILKNLETFLTNGESPQSKSSSQAINGAEAVQQLDTSQFEDCIEDTIVPDISSVSMPLYYGSDNWQSMEINAMAMKYLSDEQLTRMANLRQSAPNNSYSAKILQQVISSHKSYYHDTTSTPDVSHLGISPNNMTLGTMMYLEKHGLMGNDRSVLEFPVLDHELQLRTDFSILTNGSAAGKTNCNVTTNGEELCNAACIKQSEMQSPVSHPSRMGPLPARDTCLSPTTVQTVATINNENILPSNTVAADGQNDLRMSPILPSKNYTKGDAPGNGQMCQRGILQEVKPQAVINAKIGANNFLTNGQQPERSKTLLNVKGIKKLPKFL